jgi:hypothetical protein
MKIYPVHTPAARLQLALAERLWAGGDQLAATGTYLEAVFAAEVAVSEVGRVGAERRAAALAALEVSLAAKDHTATLRWHLLATAPRLNDGESEAVQCSLERFRTVHRWSELL